ncbi:MAG: type II toxin-antitoxin system HigB family toxin [Nitrospirae bacterium]|jgi:mRNA interferase HigB|nr:type II toxin-antitoxin system HigB family toxin [Nitrospirota bacterium]
MRIIAKATLRAFWTRHPDAEESLLAWYREAQKADWDRPEKIKEKYRSASFVGRNRVVFNIKGNKYRLVVKMKYEKQLVFVRFVGTRTDYEAINVEEV